MTTTHATVTTPKARIEVRDAATYAWREYSNRDSVHIRLRHVSDTLKHLGFADTVTSLNDPVLPSDDTDPGKEFPMVPMVTVTDTTGATLTLEWSLGVDGFDYKTSGDDVVAAESSLALERSLPVNIDPNKNPIRVAAMTHLTEMLQALTKDNGFGDIRKTEDFLHLTCFAMKIGAITPEEGSDFAREFKELHGMHHRGNTCDCLPHRCEDCNAVVPISMTEDIGREVTVCKGCYKWQTDPLHRDNEFIERG